MDGDNLACTEYRGLTSAGVNAIETAGATGTIERGDTWERDTHSDTGATHMHEHYKHESFCTDQCISSQRLNIEQGAKADIHKSHN